MFVNATDRLYLGKISDNAGKSIKSTDAFKIIIFFFFMRQLLQFYLLKSRNIVTDIFYCALKRYSDPVKDLIN